MLLQAKVFRTVIFVEANSWLRPLSHSDRKGRHIGAPAGYEQLQFELLTFSQESTATLTFSV